MKAIAENPYFIILSEYKGQREKVIRRCKRCGDIKEVCARTLIEKDHGRYRNCPKCNGKVHGEKAAKTQEQFVKEIKDLNSKIEITGKYINNDTPISCKCLECGTEWEKKPHRLLQTPICPECSRKKLKYRTNEEFLEELKIKHPNIIPLEKYTTAGKSIRLKCNICEYEWQTSPNVLLNKEGYGCPRCNNGMIFYTEKEAVERLKKVNNDIEYISGYDKYLYKKADFKCKICGHTFKSSFDNLLYGTGCPFCKSSHGERKVAQYLDTHNIKYIKEYKFKDCIYVRQLKFDFYLPDFNLCIEYDGEQHFAPVAFNKRASAEKAELNFEQVKTRDQIKNDYCKKNNIKLLRIPYTEFKNIDSILDKYLS